MNKLPVIETTKYAYKFLFTHVGKLFPMFVQYSGVHLFLYALLHLIKNNFNPTMEGLPGILGSIIFSNIDIVTFCLILPININITRVIVNEEDVEKHFFRSLLSSRTWRVLLTIIFGCLISMVPLCLIGLFVFSHSYFNIQGTGYNILTNMLTIFGIIIFLYICMRLSLSITNSALDHPQPLRHFLANNQRFITEAFCYFYFDIYT